MLEHVEAAVAQGEAEPAELELELRRKKPSPAGAQAAQRLSMVSVPWPPSSEPTIVARPSSVRARRWAHNENRGHGELFLGHVAVNLVQELADRALPALRQGLGHPLVPAEAVCDECVDHLGHAVHQAAVSGTEGADGRPGVAHPGQAGEVLVQVTVGWADHDRRSVHDVVAREQQGVLLDQPAQVIGRVAGRMQRAAG